jgi:hypothetical protein
MMRLALAAEPPSFTRKVREPGENALAALAGRRPPHPRLAQIEDGWFQLDLATLGVDADDSLPADQRKAVETTIVRLKLREGRALEVRQRAMEHFRRRRVNFAFLEMDHPFLARELARQGVRDAAQLPPLSEVVFDTVEPELIEPEP